MMEEKSITENVLCFCQVFLEIGENESIIGCYHLDIRDETSSFRCQSCPGFHGHPL